MIKYDGELDIATGKSRKEIHWKNGTTTWSELVDKLSTTHRTHETVLEYEVFSRDRQAEIKDIGGFVAGSINTGRRKNENISGRSALTLDLDFAKPEFWNLFSMLYDCAACMYSTHKHTPESPRLRLVIPLNRVVFADEYTAIGRRVAGDLGINTFDDTTFEPARLMYWPSTSVDGIYEFEQQDGEWMCADTVLATYKDWRDASSWPVSDRVKTIIHSDIKRQGDPLEKTGLIGAFCREYSISEAIASFLPDLYTPTANDDSRYTYVHGSTSGGMVTYEDKFSFSHHGTDPTSGTLVNAWDLVRVHLYGTKDDRTKEGTSPANLPSFKAMEELVAKDGNVRKRLASERLEDVKSKFGDIDFEDLETPEETNDDWLAELEVDKKGTCMATINNAVLILRNDKYLKGVFALNKFERREVATRNLPWRKITKDTRCLKDSDDTNVRLYMETRYKMTSKQCVQDAMVLIVEENSFHPVRDYLDKLLWDGTPRLANLFIDYFGAEDTLYTRSVAVKMCVAAVARIYNPGCKFDYVVTFVGEQGKGKSTFASKLGGDWYSDSFGTIQGNAAYEAIQGVWIIEMAELSGLKKADREQVKHFISKREDRYRAAYGHRIENYPRQCVFIGSTNEFDFLDDPTGNRRFWPIHTYVNTPRKSVWDDLSKTTVDQIWAEACVKYNAGEPLYLPKEIEALAVDVQKTHSYEDERTAKVRTFLDALYPIGWEHLSDWEKRETASNLSEGAALTKVSVTDIWAYCFGKNVADLKFIDGKDIRRIMSGIKGWEIKLIKRDGVVIRGFARKST